MKTSVLKTIMFHESATMGSNGLVIDKDAGIIRNVKILGFISKNGRTYTPQAIKEAVPLYEGVPVNADHGDTKTPRSIHDRLGRIINVHFVEGEGLFGDFEFFKTHPLSSRIIEAAERLPESMGFSHYADGQVRKNKGIEEVYKITNVKSVDLVSDPATCNSLSETTMEDKDKPEDKSKMEEANLCGVCSKVKEALDDKDSDDNGKMGKIKEAYGMKEAEPKPPVSASDDSMLPKKEAEEDKSALKKESVEVSKLKLITELKELCEAVKIKADVQLLSDLALLPKDAAIRQLQRIALTEAVSTPRTSVPNPTGNDMKIPEKGLSDWMRN